MSKKIKHSKLEKNFYSAKNFKLLEEVILELIDNTKFSDNYKKLIFNSMEKVYKEVSPLDNLDKNSRKKMLSSLNKNVLSDIASSLSKPTQNIIKNIQSSNQINHFTPASDTIPNGQPLYGNNKGIIENDRSQFSILPQGTENNRELKTFYSREFTKPLSTSSLHPKQNFDNFPMPQNNSSSNNTNLMFTKIENERTNENITKKPKPIDFMLPQNTKDDTNHENKFKEFMKKRDLDDGNILNIIPANKKIEKYEYESDISSNSSNSINSIKNIDNQSNINSLQKSNIKFEAISDDNTFFIQNNKSSGIEYSSIIDGLDEKLLTTTEFMDSPINNKSFSKVSDINNIPKNIQKSIIFGQTSNNLPIKTENKRTYDNCQQTIYLTILSKYRNSHIYTLPTHFSIPLIQPEEQNTVKILDEVIFKYNSNNQTIINIDNINNIISVECLDVVVPNIQSIVREPYIWLCIDEWGSSNIGTGVPKGAFARLKSVPGNTNSSYITMRAHILERQTPDTNSKQLTFRLLTSDGEPLDISDINDKIDIISFDKNILKISPNHNVKEGDEVTGFYPNVYIHNIKINGELNKATLSLRLFLDTDANNSDNRIGNFINNESKHPIIASKYLTVGDLLFLEYAKSKIINNKFEIIDIKDDIITINFPQNEKKYIPKKITKIGFIKMKKDGYNSTKKEDINYKGGSVVKKVDNNNIYLDKDFNKQNKYFFLNQKYQTSYMFRITYSE